MIASTSVAVLGVASLALGYHAVSPWSQLYGRTFLGTPGRGTKLALTYDDGPNETSTPALLEVLEKHGVKAAFFLIGKNAALCPNIVRRIAEAGHDIGMHSYSHKSLLFCSARDIRFEFSQWEQALDSAGVSLKHRLKLFRPPYGARRPGVLRIARELGYTTVMWSVTCFDWYESTKAERVERIASRQIRGGDVILMHDGSQKGIDVARLHTVVATDHLIPSYRNEGFEFTGLSEWIGEISWRVKS